MAQVRLRQIHPRLSRRIPVVFFGPGLAALGILVWLWGGTVQAGPVVCTTSMEAPAAGKPLDVTRCGVVKGVPQVVEQRFYSYTAPFAPGVDIKHQITDVLGIAMGGGDGSKVMGFGFPDQTIIWDGTALQNVYQVLLEQQGDLLPWRTADVGNGFGSSLASDGAPQRSGTAQIGAAKVPPAVRGLW